ncbi:MAG TPA: TIGR03618 family F420-dependent PPOX class oxidoreductase, partial [Acidimicrobiales bacterium]
MTPEQHAYLAEHRWALLATIRGDGSPQVSMVAYHFDGTDIVVSCRASSAKARNARRDPRAVVTVADGRRYLAVAGSVEVVDAGESLH